MPSVTTVLRDDSKFDGWRKYQGEKRANAILQAASARGTWTHDSAEHYLWTYEEPDSLHLPAVVDLDQTVSGHDRSHPVD